MAKWFGAHYNQKVRFNSAVKFKKGPQVLTSLFNHRRNYYYFQHFSQNAAGNSQCQVSIQSPSGKILPATLSKMDNKFVAQFTPMEVGRHNIDVIIDKSLVKGSPFPCNVYDVRRVKISGLGPAKVCIINL